jgi:hypothetical protein
MLEGARELCKLLLRSLRVHRTHEKQPGITFSQIEDFERARRFLNSGKRIKDFDPQTWQRGARKFRKIIGDLLKGKISLNAEEVNQERDFLNLTSCIFLESAHIQQPAFMDAHGIHYI